MKKRGNWKFLLASFVIVFAVASIGSLFTSPNTNSAWYESIKPGLTPPNWIFPVVWTILFILIAFSLYLSWTSITDKRARRKIIFAFGINFILNILWSVLYFGLKNPFAALIEIFFLWASIIFMIHTAYAINKKAGYFLVPYLIWVSFAIVLNYLSVYQ